MTNGLNKRYLTILLSVGLIIVISIASITYFTGQMEPDCPSELILLGTGTPELNINNPRGGCSVALAIGEDILVFDCGRWVTLRLAQSGIHPNRVTHLFFTHIFHFDHTCNYLDFLHSLLPNPKVNIYGPPGTWEYTRELLNVNRNYGEGRSKVVLDWVTTHTTDVEKETIYTGQCWKVTAANIDDNTNWGPTIVYRVEFGNVSIVMAWDIHPLHPRDQGSSFEFDDTYTSRNVLMELMEGADILIADAMDIHTTPEGVGIAAEQANVNKIVLTHLSDPGYIDLQTLKERVEAVFSGEVILGEDLMSIEI